MKRETKKDLIFTIIERYYHEHKNLDQSKIYEVLIENQMDISNEVLTERIKYFKDETSETSTKKDKNS
jgi:phage-related protein